MDERELIVASNVAGTLSIFGQLVADIAKDLPAQNVSLGDARYLESVLTTMGQLTFDLALLVNDYRALVLDDYEPARTENHVPMGSPRHIEWAVGPAEVAEPAEQGADALREGDGAVPVSDGSAGGGEGEAAEEWARIVQEEDERLFWRQAFN